MPITGNTRLLAVIGDPVRHSLSPLMHNAAIAQMGLDYVYVALPIKPEDLVDGVRALGAIGLVGFNITIPHKQAILPLLDEVSEVAEAVGAVNTVRWTGSGWAGTNTDVEGFLAPLMALERDWSQTTAVVLGNGGAARAVVAGCAQLGCKAIQVVGRSRHRLAMFEQSWAGAALGAPLQVHPWEALAGLMPGASLVVNTTPVGMSPQVEACPVSREVMGMMQPGTIAYDLIYVPNPTRFLREAQEQGAIALDGLEMLLQQGAAALELWTGGEVPVDVMRATLKGHLGLA
jgi:shikimate dehydrogenase